MPNGGDPPIVVSGGSVSIEFPSIIFLPEVGKNGKYKNDNKKISRIVITGTGIENYDKTATGKDIRIAVHYD